MSSLRIDVQTVRQQIDRLLLQYPEMQEDLWLLADTIEGETELHDVLTRLVRAQRDAKSFADAITVQIKELGERATRFHRQWEMHRALILSLMQAAQQQKITLPEATLSVTNVAPRPIVDDEAQLPDRLCRIRRAPDMAAIKAELQAGAHVPGVHMSNGGTTLTIRVK